MAKKSNPEDSQEIAAEKILGRKSKTDPDFERGNAFLEEHTGSATLVNLDGIQNPESRIVKVLLEVFSPTLIPNS